MAPQKFLIQCLVLLIAAGAGQSSLASEKLDLEMGKYSGTDSNGYKCAAFFAKTFSSDKFNMIRFETARNQYFYDLEYDPSTDTPGSYVSSEELMRDGYSSGLPYYRDFRGAPIGTTVIDVRYEIIYADHKPVSFSLWRRPSGSNQKWKREICRNLVKLYAI